MLSVLGQAAESERTRGVPKKLWEIIKRCLNINPKERPSMLRVVLELEWLEYEDLKQGKMEMIPFSQCVWDPIVEGRDDELLRSSWEPVHGGSTD